MDRLRYVLNLLSKIVSPTCPTTSLCLGRVSIYTLPAHEPSPYFPPNVHHHPDHYLIFRDEMAAKDYEMEKLREEIRKLQQVVVPASMTETDLQLC